MRPFQLGVFFCLVLFARAASNDNSALELIRTPPEIYGTRLAVLLTNADDVLSARTTFQNGDASGVNLLSETIFYRDDTGTLYRLVHRVCQVSTEAAIKSLGSDTYRFDRERESMFLIEARTILADGKRQPVDAKGTFIQTPQNGAQNALYTSQAELNVIYPNLAIGTSTEIIFLVRENTPVMPGEFASSYSFGSSWPTYRRRLVIDLPEKEWQRVHLLSSSSGIPEPQSDHYAPGRERRSWAKDRDARIQWEERGPSFEFVAPTLWYSTLDSWDDIATWFNSLVKERSDLGSDLEKIVDTATKGLVNRRLIIDALTNLAASDVRYTGLEFGLAGYQPTPCATVWKNHYGDCKDKANLLRAMLGYKGIKSHVALLDTDSLPRLEKNSPSWHQFNHAITAVENDDGSFFFCDPTIKHQPAGSLGMSDLAREVLVIKNDKAVWARTPDLLDSAIKISADLTLSPNGELSGWLNIDSEGSDAAYYAEHFSELDKDDLQRDLQKYAEVFFPGAKVVDVDFTRVTGPVTHCHARTYILRPSRAAAAETIKFPYPAHWLPELETIGERHRPYSAARREESVAISINLPPGWKAGALPADFTAPSDCAKFAASWTFHEGKIQARLAWHPERSELTPKEYSIFSQSVRSLTAWLEQPVVLSSDGPISTVDTKVPAESAELDGFTILPTGEGQLRLVDEKYPEGERNTERRAALQKTLQWFPHDADTVFTAKMSLALIDEDDAHEKEFSQIAADLLKRYSGQIPTGKWAWGEFLDARARWKINKDPLSIKRLRAIAENESLTDYRRGWAAYDAGLYQSEGDLKAAVKFLPAYTRFDHETNNEITGLLARLLARSGDDKALIALAQKIVNERHSEADDLLTKTFNRVSEEWSAVPPAKRNELLTAFTRIIGKAGEYPLATAEFTKLQLTSQTREGQSAFVGDLENWIQRHPAAWFTGTKLSTFKTVDSLTAEIDRRHKAKDLGGTADAIVQLILYHHPGYNVFCQQVCNATLWLASGDSTQELVEFLGQRSLTLPTGDQREVVSTWLNYAEWLAKHQRMPESRKLYARIATSSEAKDYQQVVGGGELAFLLLRAGETEAALGEFRKIESTHSTNKWGPDYLFTATLIHIDRGEYDRALELIALMRAKDGALLDGIPRGWQIKHLIRAAADPEKLKRFWARRGIWQPVWDKILAEHNVKPISAIEVSLMESYGGISDAAKTAIARSDVNALLSEMDRQAKLAAWIPLFISDFNNTTSAVDQLSQSLYLECCKNTVAMCENFEPVDPEVDDSVRMWECAMRIDLGQTTKAAPIGKALFEKRTAADGTGSSGLRLWAIATRGTAEETEALNALSKALESDSLVADRLNCVQTLSVSYLKRNDVTANLNLLKRETTRVDFDAKSQQGLSLQSRYESLQTSRGTAAELTEFIKNWVSQQDLAWLAEVAPASLNDPRFEKIKKPIVQSLTGISSVERMKYNLLFAQDENQTVEAREDALCDLAYRVALATDDGERFSSIAATLGEQSVLSTRIRADIVDYGLYYLVMAGDVSAAEHLRQSAGFATLSESTREAYNHVIKAAQIRENGGEGWTEKTFQVLTAVPLGKLQTEFTQRFLCQLALNGRGDEADQLVKAEKNLSVMVGSDTTPSAIRLRWVRAVRQAKEEAPLLKTLRELVAQLPVATDVPLPLVQHALASSHQFLSPKGSLRLAQYTLRNERFAPDNVNALLDILAEGSRGTEVRLIAKPILSSVIASDLPDLAKGECLLTASRLFDIDVPAQRQELSTQIESFLASPQSLALTASRRAGARILATVALRTSTEPQPSDIFLRPEKEGVPEATRTRLKLHFFFTRGRDKECLEIVDRMDSEMLTEPSVYAIAHTVLLQNNRTLEAGLLDETIRAFINQKKTEALVPACDSSLVFTLAEAAILAGGGDLLSDTWFSNVVRFRRDEVSSKILETQRAWLRQDWTALRAAAQEILGRVPDLYSAYYDRGMAAYHLADKSAARKDLQVFAGYCRNSLHYPEALALLNELSKSADTAKPEKPLAAIAPSKP